MNNDKQELKELKAKLNKKEIALKNTEEELEKFMLGESDFSKETLSKLLTKLAQEVSNLKTRKLELEKSIDQNELTLEDVLTFKEKYNNWGSIWEVATFQEKQQLLSTVIDYIEVDKHGTDSRDIPIKIHFKVAIQELTMYNNPLRNVIGQEIQGYSFKGTINILNSLLKLVRGRLFFLFLFVNYLLTSINIVSFL